VASSGTSVQAPAFGGLVEESLEGSLQAQFVADVLVFKVVEVLEVGLYDRIIGSEFQHRLPCNRSKVARASACSVAFRRRVFVSGTTAKADAAS
jgi:hypothetical protein